MILSTIWIRLSDISVNKSRIFVFHMKKWECLKIAFQLHQGFKLWISSTIGIRLSDTSMKKRINFVIHQKKSGILKIGDGLDKSFQMHAFQVEFETDYLRFQSKGEETS